MDRPAPLPEDYKEQDITLKNVMTDIKKGTEVAVELLKKLPNEALEEEITFWGDRTDVRKKPLFAYIGEVYHPRDKLPISGEPTRG